MLDVCDYADKPWVHILLFLLQICVHRIVCDERACVCVCLQSFYLTNALARKWFNECSVIFTRWATDRLIDFQYNLQRKHKSYELTLFIMRSEQQREQKKNNEKREADQK